MRKKGNIRRRDHLSPKQKFLRPRMSSRGDTCPARARSARILLREAANWTKTHRPRVRKWSASKPRGKRSRARRTAESPTGRQRNSRSSEGERRRKQRDGDGDGSGVGAGRSRRRSDRPGEEARFASRRRRLPHLLRRLHRPLQNRLRPLVLRWVLLPPSFPFPPDEVRAELPKQSTIMIAEWPCNQPLTTVSSRVLKASRAPRFDAITSKLVPFFERTHAYEQGQLALAEVPVMLSLGSTLQVLFPKYGLWLRSDGYKVLWMQPVAFCNFGIILPRRRLASVPCALAAFIDWRRRSRFFIGARRRLLRFYQMFIGIISCSLAGRGALFRFVWIHEPSIGI